MGRRRRAWLENGDGRRPGRPGFYCRWREARGTGADVCRSRHFLDKRTAQEFIRRFNASRDLQAIGQSPEIPISEAGAEFIGSIGHLAINTRDDYRETIAAFGAHAGDPVVADVDGAMIDRWMADHPACSAATLERKLRCLSRFFKWTIDRGYRFGVNPVRLIAARPKGKKERDRPVFDQSHVDAIVGVLTKDQGVAVKVAMTTGLDRGVIERLSSDHVDLRREEIRTVRPKTGRLGVVPLHPELVPFFRRRISETEPHQPLLRGLRRPSSRHRDWWRVAAESIGMKGLLFRDLRAFATRKWMDEGGASLPDVSRLLGHHSIETTARHYHIANPALAKGIAKLRLRHNRGSGAKKGRTRKRVSRRAS